MHRAKRIVCVLLLLPFLVQCSLPEGPIRGNIRLIIGSKSTGGDTYRSASIIADALAAQLDRKIKVDAIGSAAGFRLLSRISNGSTIMVFHDQAYLGALYNKRGYKNIFDEYVIGPTFAINPGNAYLTTKNAPYQTIEDVIRAAGQGSVIKVAIQPGGVSEIGFSALKNAVQLLYPGNEHNMVAVNTGSQSDKNQLLFDGAVDLIHGSVQANEQFTRLPAEDQKAMRFLWLTGRKEVLEKLKASGYGETSLHTLLQYVEPQAKVLMQSNTADPVAFTFDKEFFFLYNKDTDPAIIAHIDQALTSIFDQGEIDTVLTDQFFVPNFKPSDVARSYLWQKNNRYKTIIENLQADGGAQ